MKKNYILLLLIISFLSVNAQSIRITAIVEGDCPTFPASTAPRVIQVYVDGTLDVSEIEIQHQFSFADFWVANSSIGTGEFTDTFLYLVNDLDAFDREFPNIRTETNTIVVSTISSTDGGDKIRLIDTANDDAVLDVFGNDGVNGEDTTWNYGNSFVKRNVNATASDLFDESEWEIASQNTLVFEGVCWGESTLNTIVQLTTAILSINDDVFNSEIIVYPNPSSDFVEIKLNNSTSLEEITLTDILGNEILKTKDSKINISAYPAGIYMLKIKGGNSKTAIKKFLKN